MSRLIALFSHPLVNLAVGVLIGLVLGSVIAS